jgi:hypothetical protein
MGRRGSMAIPRLTLHGNGAKYKLSGAKATNFSELIPRVSLGKLSEIKKTALRRGIWFKAITRIERNIVDLTVRYVDNIRSTKLAKIVTAIIEKLQTATENALDRLVRTIGLPLAKKISAIAVRLGNLSAASWAEDLAFAKYLAMNTPRT